MSKGDPGCWRCSMCNLNYPDNTDYRACVVCDEELNHFSDVYADTDLIENIRKAVYRHPGRVENYGGATALEKYAKECASLEGVDDFLLECGDKAAPSD